MFIIYETLRSIQKTNVLNCHLTAQEKIYGILLRSTPELPSESVTSKIVCQPQFNRLLQKYQGNSIGTKVHDVHVYNVNVAMVQQCGVTTQWNFPEQVSVGSRTGLLSLSLRLYTLYSLTRSWRHYRRPRGALPPLCISSYLISSVVSTIVNIYIYIYNFYSKGAVLP